MNKVGVVDAFWQMIVEKRKFFPPTLLPSEKPDFSFFLNDEQRAKFIWFGQFDIAFIENGQYNIAWEDNHLLPEQTVKVVNLLKPKRFMPIHWGAYALSIHSWPEPVERSIPLVETETISVLTPTLGKVFDIQSKTSYWWENVK